MNATVAIETITPAMASKWLESRFDGQRKVRDPHVHRLAKTITDGGWRLTCDAVTLIKGKLGNGQHRCEAIVLAGQPCEALVLRTTDEKLFDIMDSGISRSVADAIAQHDMGPANIIAAAARIALAYERGLITRKKIGRDKMLEGAAIRDVLTRQDVITYSVENQEKIGKFSKIAVNLYAKTAILTPTLATAFLQIAHTTNERQAILFITDIYMGESANAATDLRNRLIKNKVSQTKLESAYIFGLMIKAFKAYLANERPSFYKIGEDEEYPRLESK